MTLLSLDSIGLSYGLPPLLDEVSFDHRARRADLSDRAQWGGQVHAAADRRRRGSARQRSGARRSQGLRIGRLAQEVPGESDASVFEVVASGLGELGALVHEYFRLLACAESRRERA
jgi:ABC transport system ATP-binding/permease protein